MVIDLRIAAVAAGLIVASIAVAAADNASEQVPAAPAAQAQRTADLRPIRVVLPAPWEPAPAASASAASPRN